MFVRFRAGEHLERHPVIRVNADLVARFQSGVRQIGRPLEHHRLQSMLRAYSQPIFPKNFGDFCHWPRCFKAEVTDNDEGLIDQHARSLFQFRKRNARIDVAIIIGASDHNVRSIFGRGAKKRADPVGR